MVIPCFLSDREFPSGRSRVLWDGTDAKGRPVTSGVYLYRIVAGDFIESRKMILLR